MNRPINRELYSDQDLVQGCKKGKRRYQKTLYEKYARKMYGICLSYAHERSQAQDILQDAFIKVFQHIGQFDIQGSLEGWIRRIVVNTAIDSYRKEGKISNLLQVNEDLVEGNSRNEGLSDLQMDDLMAQVQRLPDGARIVFNLYAVEGFTHKEIAEQLDISIGTSKSQYNRARKLLLKWIDKATA
ncbi:MAG: sigma-70 family RNA polymerase sigma factor [Bacteroidales bacterium]